MASPRIAVVGAGPSGLVLARLLQKDGLHCTIFEADNGRNARTQGGSLDLHPNSGQRAIREANLLNDFFRLARPGAQRLKLIKANGTVVLDENAAGNTREAEFDDRPEIDREQLRDLLLDSVDPSSLKWGYELASVEKTDNDGEHYLVFKSGATAGPFDLVVGADGTWSKVRPLVTDATPFYSGVTCVELIVNQVTESNPWLADYIGAGSCFMFDEGRAVMAQRDSTDTVRVYVCVRQPESWRKDGGLDWRDGDSVRTTLAETYFKDCTDGIHRMILEARDACTPRPLYMMPVGHRWDTKSGLTLLGDAAHVFTPFAGEGVNLAMSDAVELAARLSAQKTRLTRAAYPTERRIVLDEVIKDYETDMFERATALAIKTEAGLRGHFCRDGAEEMAARINGQPKIVIHCASDAAKLRN